MASPALDSDGVTVYQGDALAVLGELPADSVDVVLTSPPYWGLRDYGTGEWDGGDPGCDHKTPPSFAKTTLGAASGGNAMSPEARARWAEGQRTPYRGRCPRCGALRVDDQLGLEATPDLYVERLVAIFAEARRVLRDTGTLWIVIGDCYATFAGKVGDAPGGGEQGERWKQRGAQTAPNRMPLPGLKPKDLVLVPARLALALQADGWYLRKDIIWHKPNPMPESVRDRPTSSHEHVLMLAKSGRYYYEQSAALEAYRYDGRRQTLIAGNGAGASTHANYANRRGAERWPRRSGNSERAENHQADPGQRFAGGVPRVEGEGRNLRDVWTIETEPTPLKHYATYPQALCDPIIRVASPPAGTILDPFFGSGTTALVARRHGRRCIGVELSAEYVRIAGLRLAMPDVAPLVPADIDLQLDLFGGTT